MNAPRKPPPAYDGDAQQALIFARVMDLLDSIEDACQAVVVMAQCQLSELVIDSHSDGYVVDSSGMIYDANGSEKAPRIFPEDSGDSSQVTIPGGAT